MSEERQPLQNPPIEPPETAMMPGMSSPQPETFQSAGGLATNIHDSSRPGPPTQPGPPRPPGWTYDFDPNSGIARATFDGEVSFTTGGSGTAGVTSFNTRTGAVALQASDLTALGALVNPSPDLTGVPTCVTANPGTSDNQVASTQFVAQALAAGAGVTTFNGRSGAVSLALSDVTSVGGAPLASPHFTGNPQAPTQPVTDTSADLATCAFVNNYAAQNTVLSFNGRRGAVTLNLADVTSIGGAPILSPTFTGVPVVPTAPNGTATGQAASTAFVMNQITESTGGVVSFNGRSGVVSLTTSDITGAGGAPIVSPVLTGNPQAPTASAGDASDAIATTQFVETAISSMAPVVTTFNGRSGAVTLQLTDVTSVGGAPLASPAMTGMPSAPEPPPGDNSTRLATTSFVETAIAAIPPPAVGVSTFNGRSGTVTLNGTDITGAGGALQSSLANYLPLAGGTLGGNLTLGGTSGLTVGGNAQFNQAVTVTGQLNLPGNNIAFGNGGAIANPPGIINITASTQVGLLTGNVQCTNNCGVTGNLTTNGNVISNSAVYGGGTGGSIMTGQGVYYQAIQAGGYVAFIFSGANPFIYFNGAQQGWWSLNTCDVRRKSDFMPIERDCLAAVNAIALQQFDMYPDDEKLGGGYHFDVGYVAQQVREFMPDAVPDVPDDGPLGVDLRSLCAHLIGAVQQLSKTVEELKEASKGW